MKYLTFDKIKAQLRLDDAQATAEQDILIMYGESAEESLFEILNRTYEDVIEVYGRMPSPLVHATLMLVDVSYQYRSPVSAQNMSMVPYTFELLVKPYMLLATFNDNLNNGRYACNKL